MMAESFAHVAPFLKIYAHYASTFETALATLTRLRKKARFQVGEGVCVCGCVGGLL